MCQGRAHLGHTGYLIRRVALFFVSAPGSGHVPTVWSLSYLLQCRSRAFGVFEATVADVVRSLYEYHYEQSTSGPQ